MPSAMYAKNDGEWVPVYPEPDRGVAPTLSAASGDTQVILTWTAATGIAPSSYEVSVDGVIENVGLVLTYTKTGLTNGQPYSFKVRAKTAENVRGEWSNTESVSPSAFNAATGGTITTIGNIRRHDFTASGTFVVNAGPKPFDVFIIGSGGNFGLPDPPQYGGDKGGGGGFWEGQLTFPPDSYPVAVATDWAFGSTTGLCSIGAHTVGGGGSGRRGFNSTGRTLGGVGTLATGGDGYPNGSDPSLAARTEIGAEYGKGGSAAADGRTWPPVAGLVRIEYEIA